MWNNQDMHGGWLMGFGPIGMALFWALVIAVIVFAWKYLSSSESVDSGDESAVDIVKRRYAAGEIDHDEYERLMHELDSGNRDKGKGS
jgi:putative membrane protein